MTVATRPWRAAATVAALAGLAGAAPAGAAPSPPTGPGPSANVRQVVPAQRDINGARRGIVVRWQALDGSERVEATDERTSVEIAADVLFEFDRADLAAAAVDRLARLAAQLSRLGPRTVSVTGHTDNRGGPAYNDDLSLRRARAVQNALAGRIDPAFRFEVSGRGEAEPVAPNEIDGADHPDGRARNRRVVVAFANR